MKPETNIVPPECYYREQWRSHSFKFILALALLSNAIIWAIVAGFYSAPVLAIWLVITAVFFLFATVVEYKACEHYHTRYLRSICETTHQPRL